MIKRYNFDIERILEASSLYQIGVPMSTIARLFGVNKVTMWKILKKQEGLGLFKIKSKSESVLTTLAKKHTTPTGEDTSRVTEWSREFGKEGLIDILTVFLLTDASADYNHKIIRFCSSDKTFLKIFTDLLNKFDLEPRETLDKRNGLRIIFARNNKVKKALEEVYKRTPTTKHQPQRGVETWRKYLKTTQPTLKFLYKRPKRLLALCFRIGISLEGCVMVSKTKGRIDRPELRLTCFHPSLISEWEKISELLDVDMKITGKNLRTRSIESIIRFIELGCFIDGVENCSKSFNFKGVEKNRRLADLLINYYKEKHKNG